MKYSNLKTGKVISKSISRFQGLSLEQEPILAGKDYMTECLNLWNKNGVLETRPGFSKIQTLWQGSGYSSALRTYFNNVPLKIGGDSYRFCAVSEFNPAPYTCLNTYMISEEGNVTNFNLMEFVSALGNTYYDIKNVVFLQDTPIYGKGIYMVVPIEASTTQTSTCYVNYYELQQNLTGWRKIDPEEFYTPVCYRYGRGNRYFVAELSDNFVSLEPEWLEERNILNGAMRADFTCDGESTGFVLPFRNDEDYIGPIIAEYYISNKNKKVFTIGEGQTVSNTITFQDSQITATFDRHLGILSFTDQNGEYALPRYLNENSLKITAYKYNSNEAFNIFASRSKECSLDGRIFKAASGDIANRLYYSKKNTPLYFTDKAYIEVGNIENKITAIAMQNRYLFLFKEHEVYRLRFYESQAYDINKIVSENLKADFGKISYNLTVAHSSIGCDCPSSILFCGNRLVWYHSDGIIYTLYGTNNYTEGNIYELSVNLSSYFGSDIFNIEERISAGECEGYYLLCVDNKILALDTAAVGFRYLSNGKSPRNRSGKFCFYAWETPENTSVMSVYNSKNHTYVLLSAGKGESITFLTRLEGQEDIMYPQIDNEGLKIPFSFASAFFTAGSPEPLILHGVNAKLLNEQEISLSVLNANETLSSYTLPKNDNYHIASITTDSLITNEVGLKIGGSGSVKIAGIGFTFEKEECH